MTEPLQFLFAVPILFFSANLLGDEPNTESFETLADYLSYGIANNPGLQADYDQYEAALEAIPQARSLPDPKITATHFVEEIQTRTGPQRNQLSINQTIPWFGKLRLRGDIASREAEALHHFYESRLLSVIRDISLRYYDYAYLGKATEITREIVDLLARLEESVDEKVRGGNDQAPLLRLQVEIGKAQDMLQTLEKQQESQNATLGGLLGRRESGVLPFPGLTKPEADSLSRNRLTNDLLTDNPELRSLQSRIDKAASAIELSKKSPIPDPTIGAGVFDTGEALNRSTPGSGDNPWSVQLSFTIPLWPGKYQAEQREARQRYEAAKKTLTDRENMLLADLEAAFQQLAEVQRRLELYGETLLPKARQAFEVTEASYKADRSSILDLIDSERSLLEIERNYWRAVADHYQATVRIQTLTGVRPE